MTSLVTGNNVAAVAKLAVAEKHIDPPHEQVGELYYSRDFTVTSGRDTGICMWIRGVRARINTAYVQP